MTETASEGATGNAGGNALLLRIGTTEDGVMADDLTPETLAECEAMTESGVLRRSGAAGPIRIYHTTDAGKALLAQAELTDDAVAIAASCWKMIERNTMTFGRPHLIHPRMRAALDELTKAGLLTAEADARGPMTWSPTPAMAAFTRSLEMPDMDGTKDSIPLRVSEAEAIRIESAMPAPKAGRRQ